MQRGPGRSPDGRRRPDDPRGAQVRGREGAPQFPPPRAVVRYLRSLLYPAEQRRPREHPRVLQERASRDRAAQARGGAAASDQDRQRRNGVEGAEARRSPGQVNSFFPLFSKPRVSGAFFMLRNVMQRLPVSAAVMRASVALALAVAFTGAARAAPLPSRRSDIVEVVEKVSPAVVNIAAEQIVRRQASLFDE